MQVVEQYTFIQMVACSSVYHCILPTNLAQSKKLVLSLTVNTRGDMGALAYRKVIHILPQPQVQMTVQMDL